MDHFSASQLSLPLPLKEEFEESNPEEQVSNQWCIHSTNPFATTSLNPFQSFGSLFSESSIDRTSNHFDWYSDSDSNSVSCFVTDLFERPSSEQSQRFCEDDSDINPFAGAVCDVHGGEGPNYSEQLKLGFGGNDGIDAVGEDSGSDGVRSRMDGLRIVGFGSDSDSDNEEDEVDRALEFNSGENDNTRIGGFDDFDVRLCWDSLCLEDQRTLNESFEWEEVEERIDDREDLSLMIDEVDDRSVASGFSNGEESEEALRYLEWEILLAVNNLRNSIMESDAIADSYLAVQDGYIYTAEYDILFGQLLENENAIKGSPPAAKSVVENLPLVELTKEDLQGKNVACAICKDEILLDEKVRKLPCSHCYHGDCIMPWLSIRNTCPVCRFELPTDDPDYEQRKNQRNTHELLEFATQMQF